MDAPHTSYSTNLIAADPNLQQHPDDMQEQLLVPNNKRFVLFPIQYHKIWMCYKHAEANFWSPEELEFADDVEAWSLIPDADRASVSFLLAFLVSNDFGEQHRLLHLLSNEIQAPEARCFLGFQIMQGNIHQEFFNVLLDFLVKDASYINTVSVKVQESTCIQTRNEWIAKYVLNPQEPFARRLFSLTVALALFNMSGYHLLLRIGGTCLPGTVQPYLPGSVQGLTRILGDSRIYTEFFVVLFSYINKKITEEMASERVMAAVEVELAVLEELGATCSGTISAHTHDVKKIVQETAEALLRTVVDEMAMDPEVSANEATDMKKAGGMEQNMQTTQSKNQEFSFSLDEDF
ncbi:ferritin-like superfamily [Chytridium lagenaria]|nr:ferritin-like superfamily [Chytridium lagenaria]